MLMVTMMAFATDYTDQLTFKVTLGSSYDKALPEGTLTIESRVDGTYNVTACGCDFSTYGFGNWGDLSCDGVAGTTDADGLTTIEVSKPNVFINGSFSDKSYSLTGESLLVKFNGTKAYALFKGKLALNPLVGYPFEYTFGTDEGFDGGSSGGGETGGGDKPAIVDLVEADYAPDGAAFGFPFTINWETQKLVAKLDLSTCSRYTHNEGIITVGTDNGNGDVSLWEPNNDEANCHLYYTHYYYGQDEKLLNFHYLEKPSGTVKRVDHSLQNLEPGLVVFTFDKDGLHVGDALIATPNEMATLYNSTSLIFGSKEGSTRSYATYKYVKVVPADWTETTEPEVTVKEEKSFTDAISMAVGDMSEEMGQAKVTIKEMTDETISMTLAIVGQEDAEYTASGFTKTVDTEKNRTTYTGSLNVDGDDFDVTALVYTDGAEKLYMVAKGAEYNYVIGTNPDAATVVSDKTYTSNLRILDGEEPVVEETEAQVNVTKYSDETYKITLKDVSLLNQTSDLVFVGKALVEETAAEADEPLTIMAKSDGATTNVFGEQMNATFEITEVSAEEIKMGFSMESENFSYMGEFNYEEEVEEPEVYTSNLHIYDASAPETDLFQADQANVEFLATSDGEFRLTLKNVTLNGQTADLEFAGMLPTPDTGGMDPLAEEGDADAIKLKGFATGATAEFLGGSTATAEFTISYNDADEFMMTFTMKAGEKNYAGEFNYEVKTPAAEPFCKENYVADGNGFEWEIAVDWDTQKIVMSIDPSTCTGDCEHVIGLGAVPTAWDNTLNLYRTSADKMLQGYFQTSASNNNTNKFAETTPFLVEVSKAQGFVVNDEVKIASSEMSYLFTLPTVKMGTGEGANDKSRATYNYVKVVDKDWTAPKDPETGINATTVAEGEFEVFSVDGVKLSKLQKGLNIVRSADGKVKKVIVK